MLSRAQRKKTLFVPFRIQNPPPFMKTPSDPEIKDEALLTGTSRPHSATDFAVSLIALGVALGLIWTGAPWHSQNLLRAYFPYLPIIPCLGVAVVFAVAQWLESRSWRLDPYATSAALQPLQLRRVGVRLCGVIATFSLVAIAYWVLPEYHGDFYEPFWLFLRTLAPLALLIPPYLLWAERRFAANNDDYLEFGKLVLHGWSGVDHGIIRRHLLGWLVKAFFLPLMTVYFFQELNAFYAALKNSANGSLHLYQILFHLGYVIDLLFAVVGYTVTMRVFDTHTRSVEPTFIGWTVALICYQPFYSSIGPAYLAYDNNIKWYSLLQPWPVVQMCWGASIICLTFIFGLSTAAFGMRFSNLTHRGIITGGPYRFTKHPAYLSKNLSWWLISVPMFSDLGWPTALRNCCILGVVNLIYYARARTEERHLSLDPTYVTYALWIEEHGLLARFSTWLPFTRYRQTVGLHAERNGLAPAVFE
jgi:protein-S-isoprenylcysteine O-methyltransferase Ste14